MKPYHPLVNSQNKKSIVGPGIYFMRLNLNTEGLGFTDNQLDEISNCLNIAFEEGYRRAQCDIQSAIGIK